MCNAYTKYNVRVHNAIMAKNHKKFGSLLTKCARRFSPYYNIKFRHGDLSTITSIEELRSLTRLIE